MNEWVGGGQQDPRIFISFCKQSNTNTSIQSIWLYDAYDHIGAHLLTHTEDAARQPPTIPKTLLQLLLCNASTALQACAARLASTLFTIFDLAASCSPPGNTKFHYLRPNNHLQLAWHTFLLRFTLRLCVASTSRASGTRLCTPRQAF